MKKTYVTNMPDHIGAFLKASECFSDLGINITRVSYNKAVDSHTLFIDVEGERESIQKANSILSEVGYLQNPEENSQVVLLEFCLEDRPGSVTAVLRLINQFNFNISYINSQENGTNYQYFKMGLYLKEEDNLQEFIDRAREICEVKLLDYNHTEKVFDNGIFYYSYVNGLVKALNLKKEAKENLLVNVNLAMQTLDNTGLSPYKTFDSIAKFADLLAKAKGENFNPRVTKYQITPSTVITLIEPDCGSNTAVIESKGKRLFVDSGYACYKSEMSKLFKELFPDFKENNETVLLTHADVDHSGLLSLFKKVIASERTCECLTREYENKGGFREENVLHRPYVNICKILTEYEPIEPKKLNTLWRKSSQRMQIEQIGYYEIGELCFEVYEGKGGHLAGETILIDFEHKLAFTGDVYVNVKGYTKAQEEYNKYAPILMTSVDTDAESAKQERNTLLQRLGVGKWMIFGGHGESKVYMTEKLS
ncbi:MAG: Zn-dependent hydrolase [Clostridia bacterium]|nr:Zn-dependent hydrolase [Clostridia bacterium]